MKILFVRGSSPLSKAIMACTGEEVSHAALQFGRIVVHSNLLGLHIQWAGTFLKGTTVVYALANQTKDDGKLDQLLEKYEFSMYDFGGLLFLGLCYFLNKVIKTPIPKHNMWQSSGMFLCTEWVTEYVEGYEDSMITPKQLYLQLKQTGKWTESQ